MTTGGGPGVASGAGVVPDRQGEVNTQHRPSAESERVKKREKSNSVHRLTNKRRANLTLHKSHGTLMHSTAQANTNRTCEKGWGSILAQNNSTKTTIKSNTFLYVYASVVIIKLAYYVSFPVCYKDILLVQETYTKLTSDKKVM